MNRLAPVLARRPELRDRLLERAAFAQTLVKVVESVGENGAVDLESEEFKPLRARVSDAHWEELTTALEPSSGSAQTNGASASVGSAAKSSSSRSRRVAKKGGRRPAKKHP
jgi:hypothetical protein